MGDALRALPVRARPRTRRHLLRLRLREHDDRAARDRRAAEARVVDFKSIHFDLPILEYRPYRAFDTKQSSAVLIQLYAGADVPKRTTVT